MGVKAQHIPRWTWPASETLGAETGAEFVLVCEHASSFIPPIFDELGLGSDARYSHIAWDVGARDLAVALTEKISSTLVAGTISRLVYDCNRPLDAPDSIVEEGDGFAVPGNTGLDQAERKDRHANIHDPFHEAVRNALDGADPLAMLVTIHSFTPIYRGVPRDVEIGYLWHQDDRMGRAALSAEQAIGQRVSAANEPYSAKDGVTYTLEIHGETRGIPNVMIEVRNDLLNCPHKVEALAIDLAEILQTAKAEVLA